MASIGDALIYGIPFLILTIFAFGLLNEFYFLAFAGLVSDSFDHWDNYNGKCFIDENKTHTFCKADFGFLGIKQWLSNDDYNLIQAKINPDVTKICNGKIYSIEQYDGFLKMSCSIDIDSESEKKK